MKNIKPLIYLLLAIFFGWSIVAVASYTINGATGITVDSSFTSFIGATSTTFDFGSGSTLFLQTLNNGPITTGNGPLTVGGNLFVNTIDRLTAGALTIGNATATDITIGRSGQTVTLPGDMAVNGSLSLTSPLAIAYGGTAISTVPSNGQLLIGNGTNYSLNTLTAGTSTVITNTVGNVKISSNITEKFRAYLNTNQTIPGNAMTKVALDAEKFDPLNMFSTSTNTFTAPSAGYYLFIGQGYFNNAGTDWNMAISFLKNGSDRFSGNAQRQPGGYDAKIQTTDIEHLDAGDTVIMEFTSNNGTTTLNSGSANTFFAVHKLSE